MARKTKTSSKNTSGMSFREKYAKKHGALSTSENSAVDMWIPTGSRWLDSIINAGSMAGIPTGKITELAGEESTGKSYLGMQIAKNALDMGLMVVYLDSESTYDDTFMEKVGIDPENERFIHAPAGTVENVFEVIDDMTKEAIEAETRVVVIWDSVANTPSKVEMAGDFNPNSSVAVTPRIISLGFKKLTQTMGQTKTTLICLNQLKTKIHTGPNAHIAAMLDPWSAPGGKGIPYNASMRIWLTKRKSKSSFVYDDNGYRIGSEVKCTIKKSRFGSEGRVCTFKILWGGDEVRVADEESWFEALKTSDSLSVGAWCNLLDTDGNVIGGQFRSKDWLKKLEDPAFRARVEELMDEEVIYKFHSRKGKASDYYTLEDDREGEHPIEPTIEED